MLLYPGIDFLNHDPNTRNRWVQDGQMFGLRVYETDLKIGDEIMYSYGAKDNGQCELSFTIHISDELIAVVLLSYGFCLEDNPDDEATLPFANESFLLTRRYDDEAGRTFFTKLRRATPARPADLRSIDGRSPCGIEHEWNCLDQLYRACESALAGQIACLANERLLQRGGRGEDGWAAPLRLAIRCEQDVLWHWSVLAVTAGRVLRDGGTVAEDCALLAHLDAAYAADIMDLIAHQGVTT